MHTSFCIGCSQHSLRSTEFQHTQHMQHMIGTSKAPGKARHADRHAHTGTAAQPTRDAAHLLAARHLATSTIEDNEDTQ